MNTTEHEITEQVLAIIRDYDESCVTASANSIFIDEFNLDSLDMLVLSRCIEDAFEVDIPIGVLSMESTVQELIDEIIKQVNNGK